MDKFQVVKLSEDVFFASQRLNGDKRCPYGVFPFSVAVDRNPNAALARAQYEAAERFALAAILDGHQLLSSYDVKSEHTFEYPVQLVSPLSGQGRGKDTQYLRFSDTYNTTMKHIAVADVFAPFPISKGECTWHPTTNGVAVGPDYDFAKIASFNEYIERHSIMHYWFESGASHLITPSVILDACMPESIFLNLLGYDLICLEISTIVSIPVVLVLAKNRLAQYPYLVCSAGSASSFSHAIRKAAQETIQTLIAVSGQTEQFLQWKAKGEILSSLDHRMYYFADPSKRRLIDEMITDAIAESKCFSARPQVANEFTFTSLKKMGIGAAFVNLTPQSWGESLYCVRCFSPNLMPLLVSEHMVKTGSRLSKPSRFGLPHPFP
nr:YcaO-like family protein [Pseudomonas corrugata]